MCRQSATRVIRLDLRFGLKSRSGGHSSSKGDSLCVTRGIPTDPQDLALGRSLMMSEGKYKLFPATENGATAWLAIILISPSLLGQYTEIET